MKVKCDKCGYVGNLGGNLSGSCPNCGGHVKIIEIEKRKPTLSITPRNIIAIEAMKALITVKKLSMSYLADDEAKQIAGDSFKMADAFIEESLKREKEIERDMRKLNGKTD